MLDSWAGRRSWKGSLFNGLASVVGILQRLRGGSAAAIARAGGEIRERGEA